MVLAFARANPFAAIFGLLAVLAGLGLILVGLFRRSRSDAEDIGAGRPGQRYEPEFGRGYSYFDDDEGGSVGGGGRPGRKAAKRARRRDEGRGSGFVMLFFVFVLGIAVGAGGLTLARGHDLGPAYRLAKSYAKRAIALAGLARPSKAPAEQGDPGLQAGSDEPAPKVKPKDDVAEIPVDQRAQAYVKALARQLPKRIDAVTTLVSAALEDKAVVLGYAVGQPVAEGDAADFANAMRAQIESKTCTLSKTSDMRDLNDRGIAFRLIYSDPAGKTIARVDLAPNLCAAKPG